MHFITGKHMERRTFIRGMGASIALPFLDAMVPAGRLSRGEARRGRCHPTGRDRDGARRRRLQRVGRDAEPLGAGSVGREFDLTPSALQPLDAWRDHLTIVSNTDVRMAEAFQAPEIGGDHFRSSAVFLTQSHPKQTEGSDVFVGTSLDQMHAQRFGQDTPIPSMQLCIENINQSGGCAYGYTCVYTDSISLGLTDRAAAGDP